MRILVTGHYGFIGSNLIRKLRSLGHEVSGFDREIFYKGIWKDGLENTLKAINPECIFHVGANSNTMEININTMMSENFDFTYGLAKWCSKNNIMLIYSSSASVYGNYDGQKNLYAWSKYSAEAVVLMMGGVALRYFNVYGAGEEHKGAMASIMYQAWRQQREGHIVVLFPLNPKRDFVYVDDVISANIFALENYSDLGGYSFDVGTGEAKTFEDVMKLMKIPYLVSEDFSIIPKNYQFYTKADPKRFMQGWEPKNTLSDGINKYLNYLNCKL
jgi:ADP-L-glycero-D-manno-heptose 6-epimerase